MLESSKLDIILGTEIWMNDKANTSEVLIMLFAEIVKVTTMKEFSS
jgi:hypothetical protein